MSMQRGRVARGGSSGSGRGTYAARELRSIQFLQKVTHPYLLRMEDVRCIHGFIVIAMELGEATLLEVLRPAALRPSPEVRPIPLLILAPKSSPPAA